MKTKLLLLILFTFSTLKIAHAQTSPLLGDWRIVERSGGLTRVHITQEGADWRIQAWGECSPKDCDWGKVQLKVLGDNASDKSVNYGFAQWDANFKDEYMTVRVENGTLVVESYTFFKDKSGRSNYRSVQFLKNTNAILVVQSKAKGGTFLEVVSVDPASPATLKAGDKATVKVRYQCTNAEKVRIWVQPSTKGSYTPDGFYAPSAAMDGGPSEITRFIGVNSTATVDALRIAMVDAESRKELAKIMHPVNLKWEGTVAKPENVAPIGKPFPSLKFTSLQGQEIDTAKMKGKVVLVDFWATWCGPCRKEMPNVIAAYDKYHKEGFEIIGISLDRSKEPLETYIKENKMPWPEHFDGKYWENEIAKKFAVQSIPCSYLIDREGVVRYMNLRGEKLAEAIATLLKR